MVITKIIIEGNNLVFRTSTNEIVKIMPCSGLFANEHCKDNYITIGTSPQLGTVGRHELNIDVTKITLPAGSWTKQTLLEELNSNFFNCSDSMNLSTVEELLSSIKDSSNSIEVNTDLVELKLDNVISELQSNGTLNHSDLLSVIIELQKIDSNTDDLESQLIQIIANTSANATETTLNAIKLQTDKLTFVVDELKVTSDSSVFSPKKIITEFLKDSVGNIDASSNFASDTSFFIAPPLGKIYYISELIVSIEDTGSIDAGFYGNNINLNAGDNGMLVRKSDGFGVIKDFTEGLRVKTNAQWSRFSYDLLNSSFGAGRNYASVRWSFAKSGSFIEINGDNGEFLEVVCKGNLDGLNGHYFNVQGYEK